MNLQILPTLAMTGLTFAATVPAPHGDEWMTDIEAAKAKAAQEGKDLLLDFTGSDWCVWCMRLDQEVFEKQVFEERASQHFVFVTVDFPRAAELPEKTAAQNRRLQKLFEVEGFPTIVLADAQGRSFARTGYRPGGAERYVEHLMQLRERRLERDRLFRLAEKAAGLARARLLDEGLTLIDRGDALYGYDEEIARIKRLDADGKAGLREKYEQRGPIRAAMRAIKEAIGIGDTEGALAKIDALLGGYALDPARQQTVLIWKTTQLGRSGDREGATKALRAAIAADPTNENTKRLRAVLEKLEARQRENKQDPDKDDGQEQAGGTR